MRLVPVLRVLGKCLAGNSSPTTLLAGCALSQITTIPYSASFLLNAFSWSGEVFLPFCCGSRRHSSSPNFLDFEIFPSWHSKTPNYPLRQPEPSLLLHNPPQSSTWTRQTDHHENSDFATKASRPQLSSSLLHTLKSSAR